LLVRGLIEKTEDKKDQRVYLYKPTFDLLSYLGVSKPELLPDYERIRGEFMAFVSARDKAPETKEEPVISVEPEESTISDDELNRPTDSPNNDE
jgi:hypothetical protein